MREEKGKKSAEVSLTVRLVYRFFHLCNAQRIVGSSIECSLQRSMLCGRVMHWREREGS
jgi:hypothetical protein